MISRAILFIGYVSLIILMSCEEKRKSAFYFAYSLEENGELSGYKVIDRVVSNDTVYYDHRSFNLTGDTLLNEYTDRFLHRQDSVFWINGAGTGYIVEKPLFSSFMIGQCDTTSFKWERIINCYQGRHTLVLDGKTYTGLHLFSQTWMNINRDFVERQMYYDADLIPVYTKNTYPINRFYQLKRIEKFPFMVKE